MRPWAQPALDRELDTAFKTTLTGLDRAAVAESGRALLGARHLTPKELGAALHERWPDREARALATVVRNLVPLVQVPPRAVWGVGGTTRYATAAGWTGAEPPFRPLTATERAEVEAEGARLLEFAAPRTSHDLRAAGSA